MEDWRKRAYLGVMDIVSMLGVTCNPIDRGCNRLHVTLFVYLCIMERKERISRYERGESISSIAREAGVTRQTIIRSLQRAGVHGLVEDVDIPFLAEEKRLRLEAAFWGQCFSS